MMDFTKHADYQAEHAKFQGAIVAAKAAKDDLAELRAELAWRDTQDKFRGDLEVQAEAENAVVAARNEAKEKFPRVPEVAYSALTDPKAILDLAEKIHAELPAEAPSGSWPKPAGQGQPSTPPKGKWNDPKQYNELVDKANAGDKNAQREFFDHGVEKMIAYTAEMTGNRALADSIARKD